MQTAPRFFDERVALPPARSVEPPSAAALAADQFPDKYFRRLTQIQRRLEGDTQLRSAGAVLGFGAIALGALRGRSALTFVGGQALRFGFAKQVAQIRAASGLAIEPSIGHRAFAVRFSRTFDN